MNQPNIRIARLKEMIALEEKRSTLVSQITTVDERLVTIQNELYGAGNSRGASAKALGIPYQKALVKLQTKGLRKGRGELRQQILEILHASGKTGATVKDLASRIGIKAANIHSWFSINIKKIGGLKKVGEACYAWNGAKLPVAKPAKKAKAGKAKKAKVKMKAKAPKATKKAKSKKVKAGRGELKARILSQLKSAGAGGVTIKDLAAKLGANYRNVYIWFVTTGKKIAEIKKTGPAKYKWNAAAA